MLFRQAFYVNKRVPCVLGDTGAGLRQHVDHCSSTECCSADTSPMLQHHVKKVLLCQSSCKVPKVRLAIAVLGLTLHSKHGINQQYAKSLLVCTDGIACRFPQKYRLWRCFCTAEGETSRSCLQMISIYAGHHAMYNCVLCTYYGLVYTVNESN